MSDTDTYTFTATFSRSLSADLDVVNHSDLRPAAVKALVQQMRKEVQTMYDDGGADGSFNLDSVTINGVTYDTLTGKQK